MELLRSTRGGDGQRWRLSLQCAAMNDTLPRKLYAYADETGQDTEGRLFIAATVMVVEEQMRIRTLLERIEEESGKRSRKWTKATLRQRLAYLEPVLRLSPLHGRLFYAHYAHPAAYLPCVLDTIAGAVATVAAGHPCQATVLIDGLQKTLRHQTAAELRRQLRGQGVTIDKVRGLNEESDALMRLADALAGCVRHALEGRASIGSLFHEARARGVIRDLRA
jgi:hypothetical protein